MTLETIGSLEKQPMHQSKIYKGNKTLREPRKKKGPEAQGI